MYRSLFLLVATALCVACSEPATPPKEAVRLVKVLEVAPQARLSALVLAGEVRARYESPLAFRVGGKVLQRAVNLGERVKDGQVLAQLEATDYQLAAHAAAAAVTAAQADLTLAESEFTRYRALVGKGYVSTTALDQKQAAADAAGARLKAAQAEHSEAARRVDYTVLSADAHGVITALDLNEGQVVSSGQVVLRVAHDGTREIEVHVPEANLSQVREANAFTITLNAQPDRTFKGSLRELSAAADPLTRTYAARIALDTPDAQLELGMSATVSDVQQGAPVLRLPLSAVVSRDGHAHVWKVNAATSTVQAVAVRTGGLDGDGILIESGILPGDIIVSAGANLLREGQPIRAMQ